MEPAPPSPTCPACPQLVEDCFLETSGSMVMEGSRLRVAAKRGEGNYLWNISPEGRVHCLLKPALVLEVKGQATFSSNIHLIIKKHPLCQYVISAIFWCDLSFWSQIVAAF